MRISDWSSDVCSSNLLSDVARVELGNESYTSSARLNGHPASGMALQLAPGADAHKTAELVKARVEELSADLPRGYTVTYPRDTTPFIKLSVEEVVQTLIVARSEERRAGKKCGT